MVFIYLPLYFCFGFILYFVWRWIILLWGGWRRQLAAKGVGGAQSLAGTANFAGVVIILLVVAFVIGLVGFAIGRATLPQGIFMSSFPDGWGPIGFQIPAVLVGALAAAFFTGGSGSRRVAGAGASEGAEGGSARFDGRAILVAAAALFLAFAALQYDYGLLGEVTKFSAGPVVSLELAQPVQDAKTSGNSGSRIVGSLVAAAQPRTNSITYVTKKLEQIADFPEEDNRTGRIFSGVESPKYTDQLASNMNEMLTKCIKPLGTMLIKLQKKNHSEFPSVNGIEIVADATTKPSDTGDQSKDDANNERIVLMSSLLMRRVYEGVRELREEGNSNSQPYYVKKVADQLVKALAKYKDSLSFDLPDQKKNADDCKDITVDSVFGIDMTVSKEDSDKSNALGYLAMLTALAEFADGNRESAIRLLHDRIVYELKTMDRLNTGVHQDRGDAVDLYSVARKQAMIRGLIRVDSNLIELVQDPVRSPALDQIAFDLMIQAIDLDPFLLMTDQVKNSFDRVGLISSRMAASSDFSSAWFATLAKSSAPATTAAILAGSPSADTKSATTDEAISDDIVIAALKSIPGGRCSDHFPPPAGSSDKEERRLTFYLLFNRIQSH